MTAKYDFHCHSTASDGSLSPAELIQRAAQQQITLIALTDHDTISGLVLAQQAALENNLTLINGIELSVTWHKHAIHIVGLNIQPNSDILMTGIAQLQHIRHQRVSKIAEKLEKNHIVGVYQAMAILGEKTLITRSHFARFLVSEGYVQNEQQAFDHYLGQGKCAYVATEWATLAEVMDWIHQAGGVAVLAHPLRYHFSATLMRRLLTEFKNLGGVGIEVVSGRYQIDDIRRCAEYAQKFNLAASVGSDFHTPANPWIELGRLAALPTELTPIWTYF